MTADLTALRAVLGDRLLGADDAQFPTARALWNAAVTRQPAAIARCADAAEVSAAVRAARDAGLPLSVRSGGHDWAGRALRDGGPRLAALTPQSRVSRPLVRAAAVRCR